MADFLPMRAIDLIVLSEVGYYFEPQELLSLANRLTGVLDAGGVLLASHWLGISEDHRMSGDAVHDVLQSIPGLVHIEGNRYDKFRIDKWNKK